MYLIFAYFYKKRKKYKKRLDLNTLFIVSYICTWEIKVKFPLAKFN